MVLDAHALVVLFNDEPGADKIEKILLKAEIGNPRLLARVVAAFSSRILLLRFERVLLFLVQCLITYVSKH